jgi:hypothetical protein
MRTIIAPRRNRSSRNGAEQEGEWRRLLVCIAAVNRLRLTPRLVPQGEPDRSRNASRRLQRNSLIELGLGVVIIAIVGVLGTIPPALHVQPQWPFPVRLNDQVFDAAELPEVILSIVATAAGILVSWISQIPP